MSKNNVPSFGDDIKKRQDLSLIITNLKRQKLIDRTSTERACKYGETQGDSLDTSTSSKLAKKRRYDRSTPVKISSPVTQDYHNNNNVKNERLSPGTPDLSSRSRSVTPSSASHPDTPPAPENSTPVSNRNYSDFMRSLAAKYNNTNPNDYFSAVRNGGFPPPLDPRFKPTLFPSPTTSTSGRDDKKAEFPSHLLNPFANTPMFPPLIDMSSTQSLLALVRTAKEAEIQRMLNVKRQEATASPLDLSAAATPSPSKKIKSSQGANIVRTDSPLLHEDVSNWSVEDVCNFISGIDICAEYTQIFREQQIDGAGLPLLTEEHLTSTMHMKLGPALKLRSILAKKLGSCSVCLHCTHCHSGPESPTNNGTTPPSTDTTT